MPPGTMPLISDETTMSEYRKEFRELQKEFLKRENLPLRRTQFCEIVDIIVKPQLVDMKDFEGSDKEKEDAIEHLYANDGR
jgi:hypothetical protein